MSNEIHPLEKAQKISRESAGGMLSPVRELIGARRSLLSDAVCRSKDVSKVIDVADDKGLSLAPGRYAPMIAEVIEVPAAPVVIPQSENL